MKPYTDTPTIVCLRQTRIGDDRDFCRGDEIPPGLLSADDLGARLDRKELVERPDRRSLYKLFSHFTGCSEHERLSSEDQKFTL